MEVTRVCLIVLALISTIFARHRGNPSKRLQISNDWYHEHGCPEEDIEFDIECNRCTCSRAFSHEVSCLTVNLCESLQIPDWQNGIYTCPSGKNFYSGCKYCKCDDSGTRATCDTRACQYYQLDDNADEPDEKRTRPARPSLQYASSLTASTDCRASIGREPAVNYVLGSLGSSQG